MRSSRRCPPISATAETSGVCLIGVVHLRGDPAQLEIAIALAPEGQREDGHVVNGARLHQGRGSARRNQVHVRGQLLIQPYDALLFVLAYEKTHDGHRRSRARGRINVLHSRDLPQQLLHGFGDALFYFARGRSGHLYRYVNHWNDDLRLFLARQFPDREQTEQNRSHDHQWGQLRTDPASGEFPRGTEFALRIHGLASTRAPSARP